MFFVVSHLAPIRRSRRYVRASRGEDRSPCARHVARRLMHYTMGMGMGVGVGVGVGLDMMGMAVSGDGPSRRRRVQGSFIEEASLGCRRGRRSREVRVVVVVKVYGGLR